MLALAKLTGGAAVLETTERKEHLMEMMIQQKAWLYLRRRLPGRRPSAAERRSGRVLPVPQNRNGAKVEETGLERREESCWCPSAAFL